MSTIRTIVHRPRWSAPSAYHGLRGIYQERPRDPARNGVTFPRSDGCWFRCPDCGRESWGCFVGTAERHMHRPGCESFAVALL